MSSIENAEHTNVDTNTTGRYGSCMKSGCKNRTMTCTICLLSIKMYYHLWDIEAEYMDDRVCGYDVISWFRLPFGLESYSHIAIMRQTSSVFEQGSLDKTVVYKRLLDPHTVF